MEQYIRLLLTASMIVSLMSVPNAQSPGFSAADSQELASYRLTMDTANKVHAAMLSLIQDIVDGPELEAVQKTNAELETLAKREELTQAEAERFKKLQLQVGQQLDALHQAFGDLGLTRVRSLDQMEAELKANPRFIAALGRSGLTARDYSKYQLAGLMAAMVAGLRRSGVGQEPPKELERVHPDNVMFLLEHQAELTALMKQVAERSNALVALVDR